MPEESTVVPPSRAEIQKSIGSSLAARRKERGLTHEKAGQNLRIRASFIKAMEDGEWQHLPGEVYARGFVIRYANMIGLNGKELIAPYLGSGPAEGNPIRPPSTPTLPALDFPKAIIMWVGVGIVVLVALIKVIVSDHRSAREISVPKPAEVKPVAVAPAKEAAPAPVSVSHKLEVFSPLPLWLSVKADNRSFEGFIPQGATWSWKGEGQFAVRIGHTQQVALIFDGQLLTLAENQKRLTLPL